MPSISTEKPSSLSLIHIYAGGMVIFHLDAGRYYLWREKPGWSFVDPDIQDVEG